MYFVYVLQSEKTGTRYVGSTNDVDRRLREHNSGMSPYTSKRKPWKLIHVETFETRAEALRREKSLKAGQGRAELDRMFKMYSGIV